MGQPFVLVARLQMTRSNLAAWKASPVVAEERAGWGDFGTLAYGGTRSGARAKMTDVASCLEHLAGFTPRPRIGLEAGLELDALLVDGDYFDAASTVGLLAAAAMPLGATGFVAGGTVESIDDEPSEAVVFSGKSGVCYSLRDKRARKKLGPMAAQIVQAAGAAITRFAR